MLNNVQEQLKQAMYRDQWSLQRQYQQLQAKPYNEAEWTRFQHRLAQSIALRAERLANMPQVNFPAELPIAQHRDDIIAAIQQHQVIVIAGETGSGKTTQLPKICLAMGRGVGGLIGHTQPRRVAARTIATRIAEELASPIGKYVGYKVRFSDHTSADAYIKLMTDGMLLAELVQDRFLSQYDTLIIDEAHERSLNIDFILGYLKQLLPRRPDLKVLVTSATLEPGRFASYFNNAPVLEISGRTYPVDIIYKPLVEDKPDDEADLISGICDAVQELQQQGPGDILIFLSGEREIHDLADALRKLHLAHTEVLPLYARLSIAEQNKVFQAHSGCRIILATNVAETSLTVPGIRYVIDPGYVRIKRYSYRNKVQRLPIEAISQASAKQRAGRCGRIGPGICYRLYTQEDFLTRPEFTEPEILRSNLAAVILQMTHLRLGDVEQFPFINPPDSRLIRDGYKLLEELGALDTKKALTKLGQQLATLPIDPRLGRVLLAAINEHCLPEMLIVVSGLSIQDPRERPVQWQQAADEKHRRFQDERSDFIAYLKLWEELKQQQQLLSNKQFRKYCRENFISYLRFREWQDIYQQLLESSKELTTVKKQEPADYTAIHRAILTGLLGNIGLKHEEGHYLGARNTKFAIFPGSALFKKKPKWVMALEIVETSRLYARIVAQIEAEWIEQLATHLLKKSYYQPHWEKKRAQVVAYEKKVLYGLIIHPGKKVNYGPLDPTLAREIFIRDGLAQNGYLTPAPFYQHNQRLLADLAELEEKSRRRDLVIDEQTLYDFYEQRIPATIFDGPSFEQWRKTIEQTDPQWLFLTEAYLLQQQKVTEIVEQFPATMMNKAIRLNLHYRFEPGHSDDGVTVIIPVAILNQLDEAPFDWLVPGLIKEKIIALIKALPKSLRRSFVPAINYAEACLQAFPESAQQQPLLTALTQQLKRITTIDIPASAWNLAQIPTHLLMNYQIIDNEQTMIAKGRNLVKLKTQLAGKVQAHLQSLPTINFERDNITTWDFGELLDSVEIVRDGLTITAYPALLEQQERVHLRLLAEQQLALSATYFGLRRLFSIAVQKEINYFKKNIPQLDKILLYYLPLGSRDELITDMIHAMIQNTFLVDWQLIRGQEEFSARLKNVTDLLSQGNLLAKYALQILELFHEINKQLKTLSQAIKADLEIQLQYLLGKSFLAKTPPDKLPRIPVYLKGILIRINKWPANQVKDKLYVSELSQLWLRYQQHLQIQPNCATVLVDYRWLLEEYRISLFAQELKTPQPVSSKRLDKLWQEHLGKCS